MLQGDGEFLRVGNFAAGKGCRKGNRRVFCGVGKNELAIYEGSVCVFRNCPFHRNVCVTSNGKFNFCCAREFSLCKSKACFTFRNLNVGGDGVFVNHGYEVTNVVACAACIRGVGAADRRLVAVVTEVEVVRTAVVLRCFKVRGNGAEVCVPNEGGNFFGAVDDVVVCAVCAYLNAEVLVNAVQYKVEVEVRRAVCYVFCINVNAFFPIRRRREVVGSSHTACEVHILRQRGLIYVILVSYACLGSFRDCYGNDSGSCKYNAREGNGNRSVAVCYGCGKHVGEVFVQELVNVNDNLVVFNLDGYTRFNVNRPSDGVAHNRRKHFIVLARFYVLFFVERFKIIYCVLEFILFGTRVGTARVAAARVAAAAIAAVVTAFAASYCRSASKTGEQSK